MPPVEDRLPVVPVLPERKLEKPELTEEMKAAIESYEKRWEVYKPARDEQFRIKEAKARRESYRRKPNERSSFIKMFPTKCRRPKGGGNTY